MTVKEPLTIIRDTSNVLIHEDRDPTWYELLLAFLFRFPVERFLVRRIPTKGQFAAGAAVMVGASFTLGWLAHGWLG